MIGSCFMERSTFYGSISVYDLTSVLEMVQKITKLCKAIILQLKNKLIKKQ